MKLWIVKDNTGEVKGSSSWKKHYAWVHVFNHLPIEVMQQALESIGWRCVECEVIEPKDELDRLGREIK